MSRLASVVLVVRSLERAVALYEALGFERVGQARAVSSMGAWQGFVRAENALLEILEPHDHSKPPGLFLAARGEGVFAFALRVENPEEARERVARAGLHPVAVDATPGAERWYVRPADAHGILVEITGAGVPDPI
jgi:catechol 2,3-dioxygenase-like lactoylglutathione lyase family enzyme